MLRVPRAGWMAMSATAAIAAAVAWSGSMTRQAAAETIVIPGQTVSLIPQTVRSGTSNGGGTTNPAASTQRTFVLLSVVGYQPPRDGRVEVVVRALDRSGGVRQDIGRFVVFPSKPIVTSAPADAQSHLFEVKGCSGAQAAQCAAGVEVELVAVQGSGAGASLTLGPVVIELR